MYCPRCKYSSFDHLANCPKCGTDWTDLKQQLNLDWLPEPVPDWYDSLQQSTENFIFEEDSASTTGQDKPLLQSNAPDTDHPLKEHALQDDLAAPISTKQQDELEIPDIPLATESGQKDNKQNYPEESIGEIEFDLSFDQTEDTAPAFKEEPSAPLQDELTDANESQAGKVQTTPNDNELTAQPEQSSSEPELSFPDLEDLFGNEATELELSPQAAPEPSQEAELQDNKTAKGPDLEPALGIKNGTDHDHEPEKNMKGTVDLPADDDLDLESFLEEIEIELEPEDNGHPAKK